MVISELITLLEALNQDAKVTVLSIDLFDCANLVVPKIVEWADGSYTL